YDLGVATIDFEGRPDTGEDEVGTAHAFLLKTRHPVGHAFRQLAENLAPVADGGILGARATDEMNASRQGSGVAGALARLELSCDRPRTSDYPTASDQPRQKGFPPLCGLVRKDDASNAAFLCDSSALSECKCNLPLEEHLIFRCPFYLF